MASDARLVISTVIENCKAVFEGLKSLVDLGGGTGTVAKSVANALPEINCTVLDLPHVVEGCEGSKYVSYVGGDMFRFIPPADVILLESILHDWSDDYCIKILKKCKEALSSKENGGRLIIIDIVMDHNPDRKSYETQLFMDMLMMVGVNEKERSEQEWVKLFSNADLIDDACHRTGDFNLCAASLRTDPHIRTADIKGLTCIMMEMCLDKAKGISSQIERIIKQATDRGFKECLEICLKEFGLAIDNHLPYAIKQLDSGDYVDATYSLMGVDNSAETCENQFTDPSVFTSPLADVDAKFLNLTLVTGDLLSLKIKIILLIHY
ncbi:Trans-resveratrol di-O-methyltransferase [Capsicum annuum]|uniref:Trans-resveratrol di-O-methyltransferase n=1 Tax=Capsicum annuum TaxID=4072 RepID=A0A2G3A0K1_CAPAN|nr:Trans-resveratrol di-O-methyltransferase [Capsicum annuum]